MRPSTIGLTLLLGVAAALPLTYALGKGKDKAAPPAPTSQLAVVPGEYVVLIKSGRRVSPGALEAIVKKELGSLGDVSYDAVKGTKCFLFRLPSDMTPAELVALLATRNLTVQSIEPNYVSAAPVGNPSNIRVLGDETVAMMSSQPGLAMLDLPAANQTATGMGVVVAVVDSGIDPRHPLFEGRISALGMDFIDGDDSPTDVRTGVDMDGDGEADEEYGHGTFVASMVLAVAPDATILPIRVLDSEGHCDLVRLANGVMYAIASGADIINVSASFDVPSVVLEQVVQIARDQGAIITASAGNDGLTEISFPARYDDVIGVTALDMALVVPAWANTGPAVMVAAPGVNVLGAAPTDLNARGTAWWSGTSFSSPLVAGALALTKQANPQLDRDGLVWQVLNASMDVDGMNPALQGMLGEGCVQPAAAIE